MVKTEVVDKYITVRHKIATIKWLQGIRLFFILFFLVFAIILLMGSYASVVGTIALAMFFWLSWEYYQWRKTLKSYRKAR